MPCQISLNGSVQPLPFRVNISHHEGDNFVCDVFFGGDEEAYHAVGRESMNVSGILSLGTEGYYIGKAVTQKAGNFKNWLTNWLRAGDDVHGDGTSTIKGSDLVFGSSTKSTQKLMNQMNSRGWTEDLIRNTVDNPYTIRTSVNKATGNSATVFYTQQGSYVIVDDVTKAIVQISDNINPSTWAPDLSIVDPYIPD